MVRDFAQAMAIAGAARGGSDATVGPAEPEADPAFQDGAGLDLLVGEGFTREQAERPALVVLAVGQRAAPGLQDPCPHSCRVITVLVSAQHGERGRGCPHDLGIAAQRRPVGANDGGD